MKPVFAASASIVRTAACFALLAVALGAFGAHALKGALVERGTLETWKTAVDYQIWHALALLLIAAIDGNRRSAACFVLGILLFSGSLYFIALGGPSWLGPVTPLGGLSFMLGWVLLLIRPASGAPPGGEKTRPPLFP